MPTLSPDQAPVNAPKVVSPQAGSTQMPVHQPAIGAGRSGMTAGAPLLGKPRNPGLSADQPAPSIGSTNSLVSTPPKTMTTPVQSARSAPAKPAKTGLEGLTPQASLAPGRRKQIIDIISKHAEQLPSNCSLMLVEKLVEKHAEMALSGVTKLIEKGTQKRLLKQALIGIPGAITGAATAGEDRRTAGALAGGGGGAVGGLVGGTTGATVGALAGLLANKPGLAAALAAALGGTGWLGGEIYGGHAMGKALRKPEVPAAPTLAKTSMAASCPGGKLRSKGKGRGMGYGKGKGPVGVPVGKKTVTKQEKARFAKTSQVKMPIVALCAMREFVKRSSDKPKAARLFARLVKAATILNSKG